MKDYTHPIYGDGLAPPEVLHHINLKTWQRPALRRFEKACKKAGIFYMREGTRITLAFASKEEKESNMNWFEKQLELNGKDYKKKGL